MTTPSTAPSELDRLLAGVCRSCPVCRTARRHQAGVAFWLFNRVEKRFCPFCRAYKRVYGRPAHATTSHD